MKLTLQDVRNDIDKLDFEMLDLLKQRQDLVLSAAQFKDCREGETGVIVPSRINDMLNDRVKKANELGLDCTFVKNMCRFVIEHMIELEMNKWLQDDSTNTK